MNFCDHVKRRGLPLLISPILWLTELNRSRMPLGEIRDLLHLCDMVLPNSEAEAGQLSENFELPGDAFHVVRNGVAPAFARPTPGRLFRDRYGIDGPFVLNVANVEPRKNQLRLISAVRRIGLDLVIVGEARDPGCLRQCLKEGRGFVRHVGRIPHEDDLLRSAYRACEVFALPSLLETPGLAALEAAAAGARVVVTEEGSAREYFGEGAFYVDPGSEESIRRALRTALDADWDEGLQQRVLSNFTWDRAASELCEAYERVLNSRGRQQPCGQSGFSTPTC